MQQEDHEFSPSGQPLLDAWLDKCAFSRAAYRFLSEHCLLLGNELSGVQVWHDEDGQAHVAWCLLQRVGLNLSLRIIHFDGALPA